MAAPFGHDTQAAIGEHLRFHRNGVVCRGSDLRDRQHPWQHDPPDPGCLSIIGNGGGIGSRRLNRQMAPYIRVAGASVIEQADVGQDEGVDTKTGGVVHR